MQKIIQNIDRAQTQIQRIDHMLYVTFPLVKDKRILLKTLIETKSAIANCINAILQYEYLFKRISLYKSPKENLRTFENRCAKRYNIIPQEIKLIFELFNIVEQHKNSPMEFIKNDKLVILSNNMTPQTITLEKTKEFLALGKNILQKAKIGILQ